MLVEGEEVDATPQPKQPDVMANSRWPPPPSDDSPMSP